MEGRRSIYNIHERPRNEFMSDYETYVWGSDRYINYNYNSSSAYSEGDRNLKVVGIDMHVKYNTETHRTKDFDITNGKLYGSRQLLVVRRGQKFYMKFTFNRPFSPKNDNVQLVFQFGKNPFPSRGSHVELKLSSRSSYDENKWTLNIESIDGVSVTFSVDTPPTCYVGKWHAKIDVQQQGRNSSSAVVRFGYRDPIYILFNPWCEDDHVYMKDEDLLKEYILNESGKLYIGTANKISFIPWNFGQFTGNVLDCVMYLLDNLSYLPDNKRGDPVHVSRKISSLVNSIDNNGVIVGNWSGRYEDGTSPLAWTGSANILDEYYKYKKPVKYGQCYTFSGVVTTICRALGIPARCVTNFNSGHDTDGSITIDTYFDRNFEEIEHLNTDAIWNFHAWNDVWMSRPDLPPGYDGWQAIDATPQERSKGIYCLGPTSLKAIKSGHVYLQYDGPMAFAEVNADKVLWMIYSPGKLRAVKIDKSFVGMFISTKKPLVNSPSAETGLDDDREDITDQYKYPEGSDQERKAVEDAKCNNADGDFKSDDKKAPDTGYVGRPFKAETTFTNPLPIPLTNCFLRAEGPGRKHFITYKLQGINARQTMKIVLEFMPVKSGEKEIIINYTCDQLANINATRPIYIHG